MGPRPFEGTGPHPTIHLSPTILYFGLVLILVFRLPPAASGGLYVDPDMICFLIAGHKIATLGCIYCLLLITQVLFRFHGLLGDLDDSRVQDGFLNGQAGRSRSAKHAQEPQAN